MVEQIKQLILRDLTVGFKDQLLFQNLSLKISDGDRMGIVGINGAGKSTFLRILQGMIAPIDGQVEKTGHIQTGYVEQLHEHLTHSVWEELETCFQSIKELEIRMRVFEDKMANGDISEETLQGYADLQDQYQLIGGYLYQNEIHQVLTGLQFPKDLWHASLSILSGGQRTKISLAKMILIEPDILLLDEPTNFLDLDAVEWLEYYLNEKWKKGFVIVSHDRYFLDKVTKETLEMIPERSPEYYPVAYTQYMEERVRREKRKLDLYEHQQTEIMRQEEIVRRLRAGSRASIAQSRMKMLDKIERIDKPLELKEPSITFKKADPSGDSVIRFKDAFIGYDKENPLYYIGELSLQRGQKVAIMGPNGSGKTTLFHTIMNEIEPLTGFLSYGKDLKIGYYAQTLAHLKPENSILDEIFEFAKDMTREEVRRFMGRFLFTGDEIYKKIEVLSGGERARVALAKLTLSPTNVLLLDEPTNHLDYLAREALEEGLRNYKGTILFISHDRYFIDKIATHLWIVDPDIGELRMQYGNYSDYQERKNRGSYNFESWEQEEGELLVTEIEKAGGEEEWKKKKKKRK